MLDQVPHDDPLRWRTGESIRWLRWLQGLDHWTAEERAAICHVIRAVELAALGDSDGMAAVIADGRHDLQLLASAAVWALVCEFARCWELDKLAAELETAEGSARNEVIHLAAEVLKLLTVPVVDLDGSDYAALSALTRPHPQHTVAACYVLAQLYAAEPSALGVLRQRFAGVRP